MNKKLLVICKIVFAINVISAFLLFGMPKFLTNKSHFTMPALAGINDDVYLTRQEISVPGEDGNEITIPEGVRINIDSLNYDKLESSVNRELGENGSEDLKETRRALCMEPFVLFEIRTDELENTDRFEDITWQVRQESEAKIKEGEQAFKEYITKKRLWFFFPADHINNYIVGLLCGGISFAVGIAVYRRKERVVGNILFFSISSLIMIAGIVYFYLNPVFCA